MKSKLAIAGAVTLVVAAFLSLTTALFAEVGQLSSEDWEHESKEDLLP